MHAHPTLYILRKPRRRWQLISVMSKRGVLSPDSSIVTFAFGHNACSSAWRLQKVMGKDRLDTCECCRYAFGVDMKAAESIAQDKDNTRLVKFYCRRYPRMAFSQGNLSGSTWRHPPITASDWCGEFERGEPLLKGLSNGQVVWRDDLIKDR